MPNSKEYLIVDNDLRTISIPESIKHLGVEYDDDVNTLNFKIPNSYYGLDLNPFDIQINYINANGKGDVFEVTNKTLVGEYIEFEWLVGRFAFAKSGNVMFNVCLKKKFDGNVVKEFNTMPSVLNVLGGLETESAVIQENPDILEKWKNELFGHFDGEIDDTLKIPGQAADAAVTGTRLDELSNNMSGRATKTELAVERARIDNMIANKDTPSDDAELQDIRVGADGATYPTAGTAVRTQLNNAIKGCVKEETSYTVSESSTPVVNMNVEANVKYKITLTYGDNVENIDMGYTKNDGTDVIIQSKVQSGIPYTLTPEYDGNRFRFWTYLESDISTTVDVEIESVGVLERETVLEVEAKEMQSLIEDLQIESGMPAYKYYSYRFGNTSGYDIPFAMKNDERYTIKLTKYTGQYLSEVQVYYFNSMSDHKSIGKLLAVGDSITFQGNVNYANVRVYFSITQAEDTAIDAVIRLGQYNPEALSSRVEVLESKVGTGVPSPNVLILGDSYSQIGYWVEKLKSFVGVGSVLNLGVSSASIKDKYTDRVTYPYNDRPVSNDTRGGNVNTLGSQIEKLKRLMAGTDLDDGEEQAYSDEADYPNVIFIQGGHNDPLDADTDDYVNQIYTVASGYIKRRNDELSQQGYIKIPTPLENLDRTTFAGAMRYLYSTLHGMFPEALIFFITPSGLTYMSGGDHRYLKTSEQMKYAASLLSTPVIDWSVNGRLSLCDNVVTGSGTEEDPYIYDKAGEYSLDALHPNQDGAHFLAMEVAKVLRGYNLAMFL